MSHWFWFSIAAGIAIGLIAVVMYALNKLEPTDVQDTLEDWPTYAADLDTREGEK